MLILFEDMTAGMKVSEKKLKEIVAELFLIGRKLNISFVFISGSYLTVP